MVRSNERQSAVWVPALILLTGCIFFGAMLKLELQAVAAALIVSLVYAMQGRGAKEGAPILLVLLLILQNLAIGLGAHIGGNDSENLSYLTQIPFVTCAVLFCSIAMDRLDKPMFDKLNRWFWLLCLWCAVMFIVGHDAALPSRLVALRNLTCWFMAFCVARAFLDSPEARERFFRQFGWACVAVSIIGFAGMAISWQGWLSLGLQEVYIAKQSPLDDLLGWSGRFTTSIDGTHDVQRMISTYYEPVNLAYLLSAGLICVAISWNRGVAKALGVIVIAGGLLWSFGKGGWVITGVTVLFLILSSEMRRKGCSLRDLTRLLVVLIILAAAVLTAYYLVIGGAVRPHFQAIERTFGNVIANPLGHGLGSGGNAANFFGGVAAGEWLSTGGESALMSFAYQIGIPGTLLLLFALIAIAKSNESSATTEQGALLFALPLILLGISLLQDNTFAPQCIVPFMLLLGAFSLHGSERNA